MSDQKQRILVVDDVPENIVVLTGTLSEEYDVRAATSGEQVLRLVENELPDLILLDVMMPRMDGYEVCRRLRENPDTAAIPVIFVTAKSEDQDEAEGLALGAVDYITKPIRPAIVLARVATHLRIDRMKRRLEIQNQELERAAVLRDDVERITRHDLKAPLNNIMAVPRLLLERYQFEEEDRQLLSMVERSANNMLSMINRSLDLYKMETGSYPLHSQPMDLLEILRNTVSSVCRNGCATQINTVLRIDGRECRKEDECWANIEEMLCYPMFGNLLANACEASPDGGVIELDVENGEEVKVSITNRGAVPEAIRDSFFDKYVTHGKQNGTGLGTYSARLCAETQNGSIGLEVLDDDRTRISVLLPGRGSSISLDQLRAEIEQMNSEPNPG